MRPVLTHRSSLQFGHDVSVVENPSIDPLKEASADSSIWPRRQRRGERGIARLRMYRRSLFNLATTSASWRTCRRAAVGTQRDVFNLATTSASWRTTATPTLIAGNVVSSIWPRRQRRGEQSAVRRDRHRHQSSIWPRRQRRGEHRVCWCSGTRRGIFNLATTSASWRTQIRLAQAVFRVESSIWPRRQRRGERQRPPPARAR